jgi:DNA-binding winged helix-turn-helix (wHTH) protein/tetratricopeptide (TPR) repeat protein
MTDAARLQVGDWVADLSTHRLEKDGHSLALEPRMMAVLAQLCRHAGEVVSADSLLLTCWTGQVLGDNPVHKVIAGLRKALGDSTKTPAYIETIRKGGYRLIAPVRVLSGEGPRGHQDSWQGRTPFRGLAPFEREHADVFFGRDAAVATLRARLAAQWERGHPLVIVLGPSGSGKSSLLQAGLVPALCAAAPGSVGAGLVAGGAVATADLGSAAEFGLWAMLAGAMLDWDWGDEPLLNGWSIDTLAAALRDHPGDVTQALEDRLQALGAPRAEGAPLLILERLEALFQMPDTPASQQFIERLGAWVQARQVIVLAACRNDFYAGLAAYPTLMRDKEHGAHYDLPPLDAEAIAQIIRLPARAAGLTYGLDERGLNRLDDRLHTDAMKAADALPLLQYTLQELYRRRTAADELSWQAYDELGGLEGAIGQVADQTLAALLSGQQSALNRLLPRLVGLTAQDQPPIGRWVPAADLADADERSLVGALVQARLLVTDHQGGAPGCRVAHEALLRRWPRVTAWVAQHRATLALRDELQPWVQRWLAGARSPTLLLPKGGLLWQATAALVHEPALFSASDRACIEASQARLRRQSRNRTLALAGVATLAVAAAFMAVRNRQLADVANEREGQSRRLVSFMLGDLAEKLRPLGKLDLLGSVGEQGLQVLGQKPIADETPEEKLQRGKALYAIAEFHGVAGKHHPEQAKQALGQAQALLASIDPATVADASALFRFRTRIADKQGTWAEDVGDLSATEKAYGEWAQIAQQWLDSRPADSEALLAVAASQMNLAWPIYARRGLLEAERQFDKTLPLNRKVMQLRPQDRMAGVFFVLALRGFGDVLTHRGKLNEARAMFDEAAAWCRQRLADDPSDKEVLRWLSETQWWGSLALSQRGDTADALRAMEEAEALWMRSLREAGTLQNRAARDDPAEPNFAVPWLEMRRLQLQIQAGMDVSGALARWLPKVDLSRDWLVTQVAVAAAMSSGSPQAFAQADAAEELLTKVLRATNTPNFPQYDPIAWQSLQRLKSGRTHEDPGREIFCARVSALLGPAVATGHGGEVMEAWLATRACSARPVLDTATWAELTGGGYKPQLVSPPTPPPPPSGQRH